MADERATVFADRGMILQVLYNLINNAVNYTGDDLSVAVVQTVSNGRVRISVTDTGQGIEADEIPQIWERYYKVDKVHRRAMIGTGLGLSIVKGVLDIHNAKYGVESKQGEGSEFWFELPISAPPKPFEE
jgi:signal transduction histidine kinase